MYFAILLLSACLLAVPQIQAHPLTHNHYLRRSHKHSHHYHPAELLPRAMPVERTLSSVLGEDQESETNGAIQPSMA